MNPDAQGGFWDIEIENEHLEALLTTHETCRDAARDYNRAHRALKKRLWDLEPGRRYRIGRFVVTPKPIAGGGFEIPEWESQTYDIKALD